MEHFPQSMQQRSIFTASFSLPLWRQWSTFLRLIPLKVPAGQVALQEPHDMHFHASGSSSCSLSNRVKSTLSMLTVELGEMPNPKMFPMVSRYVF